MTATATRVCARFLVISPSGSRQCVAEIKDRPTGPGMADLLTMLDGGEVYTDGLKRWPNAHEVVASVGVGG